MIKRMLGAMTMTIALCLAVPAMAQAPAPAPDAAKPGAPAPTMQHPIHHGDRGKGAMAHRHRRTCFDAAWQSEEWKRCEAMMEQRHGRR